MSRIGSKTIDVPANVTITVSENNLVTVKGPQGELEQPICKDLILNQEDNIFKVERPNNDYKIRGQHGLSRTLIHNMIVGVTQGHTKMLEIRGVGYRATLEGSHIVLNIGFSHPVKIESPQGIKLEILADEKARTQKIKVSGISKYLVGQVAADIRKVRKPDPYKGKGVRYEGEVIKLKAGKRAAAKK